MASKYLVLKSHPKLSHCIRLRDQNVAVVEQEMLGPIFRRSEGFVSFVEHLRG
jgi:hypothetical protein